MRKIKYIAVAGALVALAVPSAAMADAPTGTLEQAAVTKANATLKHNTVANNSSRVIQNGQWVSGHNELVGQYDWADQTSEPGSRGAYVQSLHLLDGQGSLAK